MYNTHDMVLVCYYKGEKRSNLQVESTCNELLNITHNILSKPLPVNQSTAVFSAAISMCNSPNRITHLSSPYSWYHFHLIYFAIANNGWSTAMTGVCPGCICCTSPRMTSIECFIMATVWALSWNSGSRAVTDIGRADWDRLWAW